MGVLKDYAGVFSLGAVVGIMLALLWIAVVPDDADRSDVAGPSSAVGMAGGAGGEAASEAPSPGPSAAAQGRLERCVDAEQAVQAPLRAGRPALGQWEVHVGAMNKLVTGAITLQQATEFWDETRVGAQRHVEAFQDAWSSFRQHGVDCVSPALMAPATPALRPCAQRVAADLDALEAARTSIRTWATHVRHMEMLRTGMMSPQDATSMWLTMWQRGQRELDAYHRSARAARASGECPAH
jgi:hypothetical protein